MKQKQEMQNQMERAEREKQEMQKQIREMQQMFKKLKKENSLIVATSAIQRRNGNNTNKKPKTIKQS